MNARCFRTSIFIIVLPFILIGCGLLKETELPPGTIAMKSESSSCEYPDFARYVRENRENYTTIYNQTVDCFEQQIKAAFESLRGQTPGELSADELRIVEESGVAKFPLTHQKKWQVVSGLLSFFHPQGRPALSKASSDHLIEVARKHRDFIIDELIQRDRKWIPASQVDRWILVAKDVFSLISNQGSFSQVQMQVLAEIVDEQSRKNSSAPSYFNTATVPLKDIFSAAWKLRLLVLSDPDEEGEYGDFRSSSVKELGVLAVELAQTFRKLWQWEERGFAPSEMPAGLEEEAESASRILREYFLNRKFSYIEKETLAWAINKLDPKSGLSTLAADLVRISQRLAPLEYRKPGLHIYMALPFIEQLPALVKDHREAGSTFADCGDYWTCRKPLSAVKDNSLVRRVVWKQRIDRERIYPAPPVTPEDPLPKFTNWDIKWNDISDLLIERTMITTLFKAFDLKRTGKISLREKQTEAEAREAIDLAFTFLRFASLQNKPEKARPKPGEPEQPEEEVINPILVKPTSLYLALGLIGDSWMPDGDRDSFMNQEEFFSVVKMNEIIQRMASIYIYDGRRFGDQPQIPGPGYYWNPSKNVYYCRRDFIEKLSDRFENEYVRRIFGKMETSQRESLLHALIGVPDTPVQGYDLNSSSTELVTLNQWVQTSAALPVAAIGILMERLMLKCDLNDDGNLNWSELDCAMPLILEGALRTIESELVDLDPGTHDGARFGLQVLMSGALPPMVLAKIAAISGSIRNSRIPSIFLNASSQISMSWEDIARFIGGDPQDPMNGRAWVIEAKRRFGVCDLNRDNRLFGSETECFYEIVMAQLEDLMVKIGSGSIPAGILKNLIAQVRGSELIKSAILLSTQSQQSLGELLNRLAISSDEVQSSPTKLLQLIEEAIRRGRPLWQLPEC